MKKLKSVFSQYQYFVEIGGPYQPNPEIPLHQGRSRYGSYLYRSAFRKEVYLCNLTYHFSDLDSTG